MSNWKEYKLGDISDYINRGVTPLYSEDGVIVINQKCVRDGQVKYEQSRYTNSEKKKITEEKYLKSFDILINSTGQGTLGRVGQVKEITTPTTVDSHLTIVRIKNNINPVFMGYLLKSKQSLIEDLAEGTTGQTELSRHKVAGIPILLPDLQTQNAIAEILSSLDDKISLNNKIIQELETLGQALFKKWFIDFEFPNENGEPYKSKGGEMIDSEFGEIPKGWKAGTFGDVIKKESLKVKKSEAIVNKVYSAVKTSELVLSDEYFTKKVYSKSIDNYYVVKNQWFAYNPSRINIGSIGLNKSETGAVSPVYVVFSTKNYFYFFIEYILQLENTKNAIIQRCSGTVRQALNFEGLSSIPLKIPNGKLVIMFNDFVENNSEHIRLITTETQELINLRDSLLPKLISGELEINEINN